MNANSQSRGQGEAIPAVSILVPTYNGATYLGACLASILAQTLADWELIVVDDCSTDSTLEIAQSYAADDARIRILRNRKNLGLVGNWNRCVEVSRGNWVKFVFQDDFLSPTCLEEMLAQVTVETWLAVCRRQFVYQDDISDATRRYYEGHLDTEKLFGAGTTYVGPEAVCSAAISFFGVNFFGEPTATLIRREAFARYGAFDPSLSMICDTEYWVRLASRHGYTYVPKTLASFRVHSRSTSAMHFARRQFRMELDSVALLYAYLHKPEHAVMRQALGAKWGAVDLDARLEKALRGVRWMAIDASQRKSAPTRELLIELNVFLSQNPGIRRLVDMDNVRESFLARLLNLVRTRGGPA